MLLAQLVEHVTRNLGVVSPSPTLGLQITLKKKEKKRKSSNLEARKVVTTWKKKSQSLLLWTPLQLLKHFLRHFCFIFTSLGFGYGVTFLSFPQFGTTRKSQGGNLNFHCFHCSLIHLRISSYKWEKRIRYFTISVNKYEPSPSPFSSILKEILFVTQYHALSLPPLWCSNCCQEQKWAYPYSKILSQWFLTYKTLF